METIQIDDMKHIFAKICSIMEENKEMLCRLDAELGDGDIGLTMAKGFSAVHQQLVEYDGNDIGDMLIKGGFVMAEKAASTMGTLMASALMEGGKTIKGYFELDLDGVYHMLKGMVRGLKKRGKAEIGDKTILDALIPAVQAIEIERTKGSSLCEAISEAYQAADAGMKKTVNMQSRHGRAARYLEQSIGKQDPGATVGALLIKGFDVYLSCKE